MRDGRETFDYIPPSTMHTLGAFGALGARSARVRRAFGALGVVSYLQDDAIVDCLPD